MGRRAVTARDATTPADLVPGGAPAPRKAPAPNLCYPQSCSDASSLPEVVGDAAIKVDPARWEHLTEAIRDLTQSPAKREELSRLGRERAAGFSWKRSAELHLEVFESVVKAHENTPSCV